jgi:hypothetical protein
MNEKSTQEMMTINQFTTEKCTIVTDLKQFLSYMTSCAPTKTFLILLLLTLIIVIVLGSKFYIPFPNVQESDVQKNPSQFETLRGTT